jgi:transmembrane sensor
LLRKLARVSAEIDPGLSDRDVERLVTGWHRLGARRTARRVFGAAAVLSLGVAAVALVTTTGGLSRRGRPAPVASRAAEPLADPPAPIPARPAEPASARPPAIAPVASHPRTVRFPDGSIAVPVDDGTELTVRESSSRRIALDLDRGRGQFDVTPVTQRTFVVKAGGITIRVVGSRFSVERVADRVEVAVEQGRVLVDWGSGSARLGAGDRGWFPPMDGTPTRLAGSPTRSVGRTPSDEAPQASPAVEPAEVAPPPAIVASTPLAPPVVGATRDPAPAQDRQVPRDGFGSLLDAADLARTGRRPAEATALLRQALDRYGTDRRAPLAAFTLGRILLRELGLPREAANAFAQARALAPDGPLAEDALAREIESWSQAGETARTRGLAQEYLRRYPMGRRIQTVRELGGLE